MKAHPHFQAKPLLRLLVRHVEKPIFGLALLCCLALLHHAATRRGYQKTPQDLADAVAVAEETIRRAAPVLPSSRDYRAIVGMPRPSVRDGAYQPLRLCARVCPLIVPRGTPEVLQVENIRGEAGRGRVAWRTPVAEPARWIVITALVPLERQTEEYARCLKGRSLRRQGIDDVPRYRHVLVERVEVRAGETAQPDWSKAVRWTASPFRGKPAPEVVDPQSADPVLTSPVPWREDCEWGEELCFPPDVGPKAAAPQQPVAPPAPPQPNPWPIVQNGAVPAPPGPAPVAPDTPPPRPKHLLFRFFDFTVEPGKHYRYRVFLALDNPNYGIQEKYWEYLADPKQAALRWIGVDCAENPPRDGQRGRFKLPKPTDVISVPEDVAVLAWSGLGRAPRHALEPRLRIQVWQHKEGILAHEDFPVVPGQLANFPGRVFLVGDKKVPVDYVTNQVVVEIRPVPLPAGRRGAHPARFEILMLQPDGRLVWHDEAEDRAAFDRQRPRVAAAKLAGAPANAAKAVGRPLVVNAAIFAPPKK
jgi:hypothetical protein